MSLVLSQPYHSLVSSHLFSAKAKLRLLEQQLGFVLGTASWEANLEEPSVVLNYGGKSHKFFAQVLGSYLHDKNEWMWSWANNGSNLPPDALRAAYALQQLGIDNNIPELATPKLNIGFDELKRLTTALASVLGSHADACILPDAGNGLSVGILLCQSGVTSLDFMLNQDAIVVLSEGGVEFELLPAAIRSFFTLCGMTIEDQDGTIIGATPTGRVLKATFDSESRQVTYEGWLDSPQ